MSRSSHRRLRLASAFVLLALFQGGRARAEGVSAQVNPSYSNTSSNTTDSTGHTTHSDAEVFEQRYVLSLDRQLFPLLGVSAGGNLDWTRLWAKTDGTSSDVDDKKYGGYANLTFGGPVLNGGAGYNVQEESASTRTGSTRLSAPTLVRENASVNGNWNPADLPALSLRLSRSISFDKAHQFFDSTADQVLFGARYSPSKHVDLSYSFSDSMGEDHLHGVDSTLVTNSVRASWTDTFLENRGLAVVSYLGSATNTAVSASRAGGTMATQQFPTAGLSVVEAFPALPSKDTLNPNAGLVDGNTTGSAGLNIGFSATLAGDVANRDMGAQFPNDVTPVNTIYVWVDRPLPAAVSDTFVWSAYWSEDNVTWTPLNIIPPSVPCVGAQGPTQPVCFNSFQNRFEITIDETGTKQTPARYLKVVTKPLAATVTTDRQFAEIFVTEVQFFLVAPAPLSRLTTFTFGETINGSTRIQLLRSPALAYDSSLSLYHTINPSLVTYALVNGLSLSQQLSRVFATAGRLERSDSDSGRGHMATNRWSASLTAAPIPTFSSAAFYSGQVTQTPQGTGITNSVGLSSRADLYQGISAATNASYSIARNEVGQTSKGFNASGSTSFVPNRVLALTGSASYIHSTVSGGGLPESTDTRGLIEGTASFSPVRAVAASGSVSRVFGRIPTTLASFAGTVSPFPGADLQLRYSYQETLDTAAEQKTRSHGPGLRWNIRPGWTFDASYSFLDASSPAETTSTRSFFANLVITLS